MNNINCKYHLPCGWCELKQKQCDYSPTPYPGNYKDFIPEISTPGMISVYAAPGPQITWTSNSVGGEIITCSNVGADNEQT